ncbi:MAG: PEP-CTERM sorting domain-containing protein [Pirellulales bacterium]|nr:PEP-CTERM sorting domain-containing protein [Pirellulales bacterium]
MKVTLPSGLSPFGRFLARVACISLLWMPFARSSYALPGTTNLAAGGTATGTGQDFGTVFADAVDGNRDGNFGNGSVFYANANPSSPPLFYEVDLGADAFIERVQILRRTDADQGVFGNVRLTIFEDDGFGGHGAIAFQQDYLPSFQVGTFGTTDPGSVGTGGAFGRHVRFERLDNNYWLTFAEFEVIGSANPLTYTESNNIAAGKPASFSSGPGYGALATSGNDNNINADFNQPDRPVYHSTNAGVGEFWQVDLGSDTALSFLELFARSDSYTTSQFQISVLNSSLDVVGAVLVDNNALTSSSQGYDHVIDVSGMTGRYIKVETTRNEFLAFAELRAFAAVPEPSSAALFGLVLCGLGWRARLACD